MQLKQVPRRNISLIRRTKYPISVNSPAKHAPSKHRFKSIIEPRKMFQAYKIIGSEGEDNAEFKHPLGNITRVASILTPPPKKSRGYSVLGSFRA